MTTYTQEEFFETGAASVLPFHNAGTDVLAAGVVLPARLQPEPTTTIEPPVLDELMDDAVVSAMIKDQTQAKADVCDRMRGELEQALSRYNAT
ncbi:hypothetical protein LCGC14_1969020, partial [marine sediment metagenome]